MRISKESNVRKNEILDAAAVLFAEKGFDETSVTDIMAAVGIAKGTLYHHFKSKEAVMDALIERQSGLILSAAGKMAGDKTLPVKERLVNTILALHMNTEETGGEEIIHHLHKPQNALMHQKTKRIIFQQVPPILAGILQEGIDQGLFETPYPLECMEMAVCYLSSVLDDDVFELTPEQRMIKIQAFLFHMERLLGVKKGELASLGSIFGEGGI